MNKDNILNYKNGNLKFIKCIEDKMNFYNFIRTILDILLKLIWKIEINGINNIPTKGPFIIVANHSSLLDGFVMVSAFKNKLIFFSAAYLFDNPFVGFFLRKVEAIPVSTEKKKVNSRKPLKEAINRLANGKVLMMFPEGGLRTSGEVKEIKNGAAYISIKSKVPVLPVSIKGTSEILPKGSYFPRKGRISVSIGSTINPLHDNVQKDEVDNMAILIKDSINNSMVVA